MAPIGLLMGVPQVYVVPTGTLFPPLFAGVTVKDVPEQIADGVTFAIDGFGFTVTVIVKVFPEQLPEVGVTV